MDEGVSIDVSADSDVTVVAVAGEIDMANAADVARRVLAVDESPSLVLDLSTLGYIDSAGIRMLFDVSERLSSEDRRFVLAVARDAPIRRALAITKLATLVPVCDDLGGAVEKARVETA